ncbi:MAG: hypothetical protein AB7S26_34170 [Sandaracinaceae bacterium]
MSAAHEIAPWLAALAIGLAGCADREPEVTPIAVSGAPAPEAEPPSELITNPHVNLRPRTEEERRRELERLERSGLDTGGGGGGSHTPHTAGDLDQREVDQYRTALEREQERGATTSDDPCDQLRAQTNAAIRAGHRPGEPSPELPNRGHVRAPCLELSAAMRQCFDRAYARTHREECMEQIGDMTRVGRREARVARNDLAAARENGGTLAPPPEAAVDDDEELPALPSSLFEGEPAARE